MAKRIVTSAATSSAASAAAAEAAAAMAVLPGAARPMTPAAAQVVATVVAEVLRRGIGAGSDSGRRLAARRLPEGRTSMDPRLQRARTLQAAGLRKTASVSTAGDEIAVIAKVSDADSWNALSEVRPGSVLGEAAGDGTVIVTARIPIKRLEFVRSQAFVLSLKAAQRVHRYLASTTAETLSRPADLPPGSPVASGAGVVVGVVDFGGDFAHENFQRAGRKTRLRALWDQGNPDGSVGTPSYGKVHRPAQINAALKRADPYAGLGYHVPAAAHGTHVMDIAAGNGRGSKVPGMAPKADLVFVELAASDVPWQGPTVVNASFGDSVQLLEALSFVFEEAGSKPCVVNLSLGTNGGPHDGSTLVEQGIDRLVRARPNRAVVIAASNSFADGIHAQGVVRAGSNVDLQFETLAGPQSEDEVEVWFAGKHTLSVELVAPDGSSVCSVGPGESVAIDDAAGQPPIGVVANRLKDPTNGDNVINVWLAAAAPKGVWTLRLGAAETDTDFHAWIERNDDAQASFRTLRVDSHTLGSISCGAESIVVSSYDAHKAARPISWFSSEGPTRDGRKKPDVAAPGHAVVAARSRSKTGTVSMSGTSMAAPAVAGLVALVLSEARGRGKVLDSAQIRNLVAGSARLDPPKSAWDSRYGAGRICGHDAVAGVVAGGPPAGKRPPAGKAAKSRPKPVARKAKAPARKSPRAR